MFVSYPSYLIILHIISAYNFLLSINPYQAKQPTNIMVNDTV